MATTFTAPQQLIRTAIATLSPEQFARLRPYLDAARVHTDFRLAQIEAERTVLLTRKQKLEVALQRLARPDAFEALRGALKRGERLSAPVKRRTTKGPAKRPAKGRVTRPGR